MAYNILNCSLIDWSADDVAYLNKRLLGFGIVVCNKVRTSQVQLLRVILQNISQLRNEAGQLDRLADLVLGDTKKFSNQRPGVIPLAILAKGELLFDVIRALARIAKAFTYCFSNRSPDAVRGSRTTRYAGEVKG